MRLAFSRVRRRWSARSVGPGHAGAGDGTGGYRVCPGRRLLEVAVAGPGRLVGSGHPARAGAIHAFEVDPADPRRIVAASDTELYRSADGGAAWQRIGQGSGIRLAWPVRDALYRALKDGSVQRSSDGGTSWATAGRVDGEP